MVIFWTVFLAELGDKTQLATILFATERGTPKIVVFSGAMAALALATALAVFVGDRIGQILPFRLIKVLAGAGFILVGLWIIVRG